MFNNKKHDESPEDKLMEEIKSTILDNTIISGLTPIDSAKLIKGHWYVFTKDTWRFNIGRCKVADIVQYGKIIYDKDKIEFLKDVTLEVLQKLWEHDLKERIQDGVKNFQDTMEFLRESGTVERKTLVPKDHVELIEGHWYILQHRYLEKKARCCGYENMFELAQYGLTSYQSNPSRRVFAFIKNGKMWDLIDKFYVAIKDVTKEVEYLVKDFSTANYRNDLDILYRDLGRLEHESLMNHSLNALNKRSDEERAFIMNRLLIGKLEIFARINSVLSKMETTQEAKS